MSALEVIKKMKESVGRAQSAGTMHEIEFTFRAPDAKKVCIAGKFNNWNTSSMPMKKGKDGTWRIKVKLPPGRHEFKYFMDGVWAQDIPDTEKVSNPFGTYNYVIGVE